MNAAGTTEPTPEEWLSHATEGFIAGREISHPDPKFDSLRARAHARLVAMFGPDP
jgi:hypothetical protein